MILGELAHVLVGLADNIMVGKLGAAPLAAISLANSLLIIAISIGIGFSFAITPVMAEIDGSSNIQKGRSFFQHGVVLCSLFGVLLFGAIYLIKPILYHLDQPPEVVELSFPYINIVAFSLIPLMVFQAFKQFGDGLSQTKYAMIAALIANALNVLINYLLIYGIWFFPRLELEGAAIGTLISRGVMLGLLFYVLRLKQKFKTYFIWAKIKFEKNIFQQLLQLGFPTALQMFFEVGIFTASVFLAGTLGTVAQAANQIALNLSSMTFMVAVGIGVAAMIRVGNQKGKRNFVEMKRLALSNFLLIFCIESVFVVGFITLKNILPTFYIENEAVIELASDLLIVAALFQLSDGLQVVILGALRGLQDVYVPTLICFTAYWLIGFPVSYFLGKPENLGSTGIWLGLLVGLSASAAMLYSRFTHLNKNFN